MARSAAAKDEGKRKDAEGNGKSAFSEEDVEVCNHCDAISHRLVPFQFLQSACPEFYFHFAFYVTF